MSRGTDFLSFPCKRTDKLDIKTPISRYVIKAYGKERAGDILEDVDEVVRKRNEAVAVSGGGPSEGAKEILASYYRALSVMETRFPVSRDGSHAQIPFYWMNALNPRKRTKQFNIHFEKSSILFNIAALLSQQGARQHDDAQSGYKDAMRCFQEAASVFALARQAALKVENPRPVDLTMDFLMMVEKLMMAQGQECVYWIASRDNKSPFLLSRLAKQTSILFAETLQHLAQQSIREDMDRTWQDYIQSKSWLFEALCQLNAAQDAKTKEDISSEIARLERTIMLIQRLQKTGKFATGVIPSMMAELIASTKQRLTAAERDNASVFLKRVPSFNDLPVITGAQLVKLVECPYLDASTEHIFSDLVPEAITKALSRYSELVDGVIRKQTDKLNGATDEARVKLKEYELPDILDAVSTPPASILPESLKTEIDQVEQCGGLASLEDMRDRLTGLKTTLRGELAAMKSSLEDECTQDTKLREYYGQKWTSATSASQTVQMQKSLQNYEANIANADNSDRVVQEKLAQKTSRFALLSLVGCVDRIPKLESGMINTSDLEPQTLIANLRNCLEQLNKMSADRAGLEESLKDLKNQDNLLPKLVATGVGSHEELFKTELEKYDPLKADVDEVIKKQQELFVYMRTAVSSFQQTFDIAEWRKRIEQFCAEIKADIAGYYDLRNNLAEGTRFYMSLHQHCETLKQQIADYVLSRKLEREDRLELLRQSEKPADSTAFQAPPPVPTESSGFASMPPSDPQEQQTVNTGPPRMPGTTPVQHVASFQSTGSSETHAGVQDQVHVHHPTAPPAPAPLSHYQQSDVPVAAAPSLDPMTDSPNPYGQPGVQPQPYQDHYTNLSSYQQQGLPPTYQPGGQQAPPPSYQPGHPYQQQTPYGHYSPSQQAASPPPGYPYHEQGGIPPVQYPPLGAGQAPQPHYQHGAYPPPAGQQAGYPYPYPNQQPQQQQPPYPNAPNQHPQQQQPPYPNAPNQQPPGGYGGYYN